MSQPLDTKIIARVHGSRGGKGGAGKRTGGSGRVFTPADFLDLGSRAAVDKALARAALAGRLRRLGRGLYDDPRRATDGSPLPPTTDAIIRAIAGRHALRVQPSGAHAANLLGLSEQVPVRMVFLTDGRGRTVALGRRAIVLRHTSLRRMALAGRKSGTIVQALHWLGRANVDDRVLAKLRRTLTPADRRDLRKAMRYAPIWIAALLRRLAPEERD